MFRRFGKEGTPQARGARMKRRPYLPTRRVPSAQASRAKQVRQLWILSGAAVVGSLVAGIVSLIDSGTRTRDDIVVYRVHGCTCVFSWVDSLRKAGFVVRVVELGSLKSVRAIAQTPAALRGCHMATYLNYFVEGHVPPTAFRVLADARPIALGVTTATSADPSKTHVSIDDEEHSAILLVEPSGRMLPWLGPATQSQTESL